MSPRFREKRISTKVTLYVLRLARSLACMLYDPGGALNLVRKACLFVMYSKIQPRILDTAKVDRFTCKWSHRSRKHMYHLR